MQPRENMQPLFNSFPHQIQSNGSTAPVPQQQVFQPQIPYYLGNMAPPLMPQPNPLVFAQNSVVGAGHMFPVNGQFCNFPSQAQMFPPPQTLPNPQLCFPFFGNPQFGLGGQQSFLQPAQQLQGNSSMPLNSCSSQQHQTQNPQSWSQPQGNSVQYNQGNISNTNWKNVSGKNFTRNPKRGFQKSQFHHANSVQGKFGFHNEHNTKGRVNERAAKFGQAFHMNPPKEKKRSLALTYTDQEIQQWREERKRNYPSKANIEEKLDGKPSSSKVIDKEAKIRREQLKEILAKQAELGVEVAEIPSHYLSDSERRGFGREENTRPLTKRGRFQNKRDKRGRYNRKDHATKKHKLLEKDSSKITSICKRKPTLLQKLLSADIRRDKSSLLQVFRFMVMNSFFKDGPEKPLKFPSVTVKENRFAEEKALKDVSKGSSILTGENGDYVDNQNINGEDDVKGSILEEEEGEIID